MTDILHFEPKSKLDASANLSAFIDGVRTRLTVFGAGLRFDNMIWDTGEAGRQRGLSHRIRITFCTLDSRGSAQPKPMAEPFGAFAKAYIRYMQGVRPVSNQQFRMSALRAVESAMIESGAMADPVRIDPQVLNRAAQLVKRAFGAAAAYRIGGQIEVLSRFLQEKRLAAVPHGAWRNPLNRPCDRNRVGEEFAAERERKLPTQTVLEAVAIAFRTATNPGDVIRICAAAIMCSAPDRVGEVLTLPADCEVRLGRTGKEAAYGLRWWPEKGAAPMVKWIVPGMADIVETAIERIRRHTDEARRIAAWYESHPREIYLPRDMERLRGADFISEADAGELLGLDASKWARRNGIAARSPNAMRGFDFSEFEAAVVSMLPQHFPVLDRATGIRHKDALFVAQRNLFRTDRSPSRCMVEPTTQQHIGDALGNRVLHGHPSIFTRLNLTEPNGDPVEISSHQFRHWLNTLAQQGGLSQLDIAKWSGRKDVRQNRAYDHMPSGEILELVRGAVGDAGQLFGPLSEFRPNAPMSRDQFAKLEVPTAHTTDFGFCIHDFAMLPCQLHSDCINCAEHVCVKGGYAKEERIRRRLEEARGLLTQAEVAAQEGIHGADRWRAHHTATLRRLEQLVAILDDPTVPEGSVIQLGQGAHGAALLPRAERGPHRGRLRSARGLPAPDNHDRLAAAGLKRITEGMAEDQNG